MNRIMDTLENMHILIDQLSVLVKDQQQSLGSIPQKIRSEAAAACIRNDIISEKVQELFQAAEKMEESIQPLLQDLR